MEEEGIGEGLELSEGIHSQRRKKEVPQDKGREKDNHHRRQGKATGNGEKEETNFQRIEKCLYVGERGKQIFTENAATEEGEKEGDTTWALGFEVDILQEAV